MIFAYIVMQLELIFRCISKSIKINFVYIVRIWVCILYQINPTCLTPLYGECTDLSGLFQYQSIFLVWFTFSPSGLFTALDYFIYSTPFAWDCQTYQVYFNIKLTTFFYFFYLFLFFYFFYFFFYIFFLYIFFFYIFGCEFSQYKNFPMHTRVWSSRSFPTDRKEHDFSDNFPFNFELKAIQFIIKRKTVTTITFL